MGSARNRRRLGWLALGVPVVAVLLAIIFAAGPAGASAPRPSLQSAYPTLSWTNGEVLCATDPSTPSATVTASGDAGAGLWMGVGNISQESVAGVAAATADLTTATWTVTNISGAHAYGVTYRATVPVVETALLVLGLQIGSATVVVTISMEDYPPIAHPASGAFDVWMELNITGWPWLASLGAGPLVADLGVAPASLSVVHLVAGSGNATVAAVNGTGTTMAYLSMGTSANVTSSLGVTSSVGVLGHLLSVAASGANVEVNFTAAATGASAMNYTSEAVVEPAAVVTIPPNIPLPGAPPIPTVDFLAVGGGAVLVSLAIAGGARRARRSTSDLEYVTEEEQA